AYNAIIGNNTPVIIKTDSIGNLIWTKVYPDLPGLPRSAIETIDHRYLIGINGQQGKGMCLTKTDTSGIVIWSKSYLRPDGVVADLIEKPDGNLLVAGNTGVTSQTPYPLMYLMELDSAGDVLWTKTYGDSTYQLVDFDDNNGWNFLPIKIKQTIDGGLILLTTITNQGSNADLVMLKTDSVGNLEWERRRGDGFFSETGLDLIQTPDSGYFVIGGFYRSPIVAGYYLLKTDSLGLIGCGDYSDIIPVNNLLPTDSSIVVTDSAIVINQSIAWVHDTIYAAADSLSGCIIDYEPELQRIENSILVFPNPTLNSFHLILDENLNGEKNILIYDLFGKEVSSTMNTYQTDFEFTLIVKGIYLVRIVSKGKSLVAKVVVI
ncbi:MAG: T9SS type A sorting domain-containing protein, partial [Bacteroidota bacterium]